MLEGLWKSLLDFSFTLDKSLIDFYSRPSVSYHDVLYLISLRHVLCRVAFDILCLTCYT